MKNIVPSALAALAVIFGLSTAPTHAAVINGVDFTSVYDGTALPPASTPSWTQVGSGGTASVSGGILTQATTNAESRFFQITGSPWSPGASGSTIELNLKVDSLASGATYATGLIFATGSSLYGFSFAPDAIVARFSPSTAFDTTAGFATYRITISAGGSASLYINNSTTAVISGYTGVASAASPNIYFGDGSTGTVGGTTQFDYIAFTNAGAFAPVPEPSSLALLGLAMFMGTLVTRRR